MSPDTIGTPALWIGFVSAILALLALDLGVFHRHAHVVSFREALGWSIVWVVLAMGFNAGVYWWFGPDRALEFLAGYLIEKALSVDNVFVFLVLFSSFGVPAALLHRVLFWGIVGALVMRALFIVIGAALLSAFHWVMYLFGALLFVTGIRMLRAGAEDVRPERNPVLRWFARVVPSVPDYRGGRFWVKERGRWLATPLVFVLVAIELTDLLFAVDSIPAVFAVTRDPFIVFTSNIFAILGLRAMFFLLAGVMHRFVHLKTGLALVLAFVGTKMLVADIFPIPIAASLAVVALLIGGAIALSLLTSAPERPPDALDVPLDESLDRRGVR
jgi:tellurite resistance protein TerC